MPLYLFRINNKRTWERDEYELPWLGADEVPADVFADFRIENGELSLWHIEDDRSNLLDVVAALAATRESFAHFDYGLFAPDRVAVANVKLVHSEGVTPLASVNHWHRDVVELTVDRLAALANALFDHMEKERVLKRRVEEMIVRAVRSNQIDLTKVKDKMREKLTSLQSGSEHLP